MNTTMLDRLLEPITNAFTVDVARRIVEMRLPPELESRVELLRHKANTGTLSADEDREYKEFVEAVDVVSLLQAKARESLARVAA